MRDLDAELLAADREARRKAYDEGLARYHAEHGDHPHLTRAAIQACGLCDADGYRGTNVCDHTDHRAAAARGIAACRAPTPPPPPGSTPVEVELTPIDAYRIWIDQSGDGDAMCTCGYPYRLHYADLSGCSVIESRCKGFNLARSES